MWTQKKLFPRFGVLVLKHSSLLTDFAAHGFLFPPKSASSKDPLQNSYNTSKFWQALKFALQENPLQWYLSFFHVCDHKAQPEKLVVITKIKNDKYQCLIFFQANILLANHKSFIISKVFKVNVSYFFLILRIQSHSTVNCVAIALLAKVT